MYVDFTPEQRALRSELRSYFEQLVPADSPGWGDPAWFRDTVRQMGKDGWLGVGWPREYGGQGRTAIEQMIFFEEARRVRAPFPFVTINTVGPALLEHGSDEQKRRFLPGILAGETHFAIGYTEPESGTDLASLQTRAVREGDGYVVNGTKIFTTSAQIADYVWLATRTDPGASKHRGISILIVDTKDPGFSRSPIETLGGDTTNMTYYEDVRVPESMRVGPENAGWTLITTQLNHERVGLAAMGALALALFDEVVDWARDTEAHDGGRVIDQPWVQSAVGEAYARLEAMKLLNWRLAWELGQGRLDPGGASAAKVYGTECQIEAYRLLREVLGAIGGLRAGSAGAALRGRVEFESRSVQINTFGGGVNEVQREIVAWLGLGMPRPQR